MEPVDIVRLNITDTKEPQLFTDEQLNAWLAAYDGNVNRATYRALITIATSTVLVSKKMRTQDLSTDGPAESAALLKLAETYKAEADAEQGTDDGFLELIPFGGAGHCEAEEYRYRAW